MMEFKNVDCNGVQHITTIENSDDLTWDDAFQEFFQFMVGCGYIFPKNVRDFDDLCKYLASNQTPAAQETQTFIKQYTSGQPITRWSPDCLQSSTSECPFRTGYGKCTSSDVCTWKQGYNPND